MEPKKPLYLSQHAKDKVAERQVALEMVQETMQKGTHRPAKDGKMVAEKNIGGAKVRVVYAERPTEYFVLTVTRTLLKG
jgi:hypothetical protein